MPPRAHRPVSCPRVEQRPERIIVETDRHRITGHLLLPADGYRSRLTDYLNAAEREFLALTDVEVATLDGTARIEKRDFIALSLRHVVLAMPADETAA
jgi:2-polyprenyl-6-methoxyphenol hydroxylase-like FAD-dependent oxidoreductase